MDGVIRPADGKRLLSLAEAARELGIGRSMAYRLRQEGRLPVVRVGADMKIRREDLEAFVASLEAVT